MENQQTRDDYSWVVIHYLIILFGIMFVTVFLAFVYATKGLEGLMRINAGPVVLHFDSMPVILIASIVGFAPAMVSFLFLFIGSILIDIGRSYTVFVYLIAAIVSFLAVRRRIYSEDALRLWLLAPILAFILGDIHMILASLAGGLGFVGITPKNIAFFFLGELPECTLAVLLSYMFLIKAPDPIRLLTSNGRLYVPGALDNADIFARIRYSKLSRIVVGLICLEGIVLGVAASAFANALLPSLGDEAFSNREGSFFEDIRTFYESPDTSEELEEQMDGEGVFIDALPSEKVEDDEAGSTLSGNAVDISEKEDGSAPISEAVPHSERENGGVSASEAADTLDEADGGASADNAVDISKKENRTTEIKKPKSKKRTDKQKEEPVILGRRRFVLNRSGLAFDIKLIMLLLNTAVPFTVLSNLFAQNVIVSPIIRMSESMQEFCDVPQGDKEAGLKRIQRLPIHNEDEIGELYLSLCKMAASIVHFVDEEREKEKLAAELLIARKTSENKSHFLSNVSHELRTPINAVLGLDEMILRESSEEAVKNYAADIQNAGKTLLGLVNDILDTSKLEEGKMELIPTEYELSSMINDLVNMIAVKARDKGLHFIVRVDEDTPQILYGDEIRLKQIIVNILTNAVKYTHEGSVWMEVGYEKMDENYIQLKVSIKDTGIGMREEDLDKLYSRFERIEEDRNKNIEGTGLGMNIVRQLLALMHSELKVASVYGEGSDFSFKVIQEVVRWQPIGNFSEAYQQFAGEIESYEAGYVAPKARILVVDDTPMNLTVVKGLLRETLIEIITAESGAEAIEKAKETKFDLIFMDQRMPEMDGVEAFHVLQRLSEEGENASEDSPVIMLTANAVSGSREQFLKEGFADYLSKPIDPARLESMVRDYLPAEKLIDPVEYAKIQSAENLQKAGEGEGYEQDEAKARLIGALQGLALIDYEAAVKNCGSDEVLLQVIEDYLEVIPSKISEIKAYLEARDYKNYSVLVHAIKSSSHLLGAMQLSEDAAHLEEVGDKAAGGDRKAIKEIAKKTPVLLSLYRSYYDKLMPLLTAEGDEDLRPELPPKEMSEAIRTMREFVEAFDFDSADGVIDMIKDYKIPKEYADRFEKIRVALSSVDREALLELLV